MPDDVTKRSVRATYEHIADHFAKTRAYAWPEVEAFVESEGRQIVAQVGDEPTVGLDLGCGNGRHAELLTAHVDTVLGLDASRGLLHTGLARTTENNTDIAFLQGDAGTIPLSQNSVAIGIYVATLHHLPTQVDRIASLDALSRVLHPDGRALVSVWATIHDAFSDVTNKAEGFDTTMDWTLPGGEKVDRFYHIYAPDEFKADVKESTLSIDSLVQSSGNLYAVVAPEGKRS